MDRPDLAGAQLAPGSAMWGQTMLIDSKAPKYPILDEIEIPEKLLQDWQITADLLADIAHVSAVLVMRVHARELEVVAASRSPGNVYRSGARLALGSGLYCETVMSTRQKLLVPNALQDICWAHNPGVALGMISYFGLPLTWPNGELFGTFCILDQRANSFGTQTCAVLERFGDSVQLGLAKLYESGRHKLQRDLAEAEMRSASQYARSLIETSLDPLVTISAEGKITDVNEATVQVTGVPRQQLIASDFSAYFTEPEQARAGYQQVFAKGLVKDYPLTLRHVSGTLTEVLYNASIYRNEEGEVAGVFAAARDITERKRAEDELARHRDHLEELVRARTDELEAVNHDLEGFAYSVSHDLRGPLRAIDGFSRQVLKHCVDQVDADGQRYLNLVRENTRKMSQLIDDILAFSRMGRLGINVAEVDMEALVRAAIEELTPALLGHEPVIDITPLPPCQGDVSMLRQVWVNLLGNALKFTRPKAAPRVEVTAYIEDAEAVYCVKDNGVGFDMQYADKLFGVFQRLHGIEEFEGTGIGLAIVKRIITRLGGRVWAQGQVDQGATFCFALPTTREKTR